jgi:hypothetical protein
MAPCLPLAFNPFFAISQNYDAILRRNWLGGNHVHAKPCVRVMNPACALRVETSRQMAGVISLGKATNQWHSTGVNTSRLGHSVSPPS